MPVHSGHADPGVEHPIGLGLDHRRAERLHATVYELGLTGLRHGTPGDDPSALCREHIETEEQRVFPRAPRMLSCQVLKRSGRDTACRRGVQHTVQLRATAGMQAS
jgi:hypothetical protein